MNIKQATESYEQWLSKHIHILKEDIEYKHDQMRLDPFTFLRATFYRWAQIWPDRCSELAEAPKVLAIGDLHIENFGTWRDAEGRLVWGVNDFDEAYHLAYTNDLVRLAASASFAIESNQLAISPERACSEILDGYSECLKMGGRPFVLAEDHAWLRQAATSVLRDPDVYWKKLGKLTTFTGSLPINAEACLQKFLPAPLDGDYRIVHRRAGEGSLGHVRFTAIGILSSGQFAREVKELSPSAVSWAQGKEEPQESFCDVILARAVRCTDPWYGVRGKWLGRRIAPDCSRIELTSLPAERDDAILLRSMGFETGNIHLGTPGATKPIREHLKKQKKGWLYSASKEMARAVQKDWEQWRANA